MTSPEIFVAGPLEDGQTCPCCQEAIQAGQRIGRCPKCYHLQHETCWQAAGSCCSYECGAAAVPSAGSSPDLVITAQEVARASVPVAYPPGPVVSGMTRLDVPSKRRLSILAVAAFICALFGIPPALLMAVGAGALLGPGAGLVPVVLGAGAGLLGIVLGAIAIGAINVRKHVKGSAFAAAGIIIGVLTVVGWSAAGALYLMQRESWGGAPEMPVIPPLREHFTAADLADLPQPIRRAICANVLIVVSAGLRASEGSGVVLERRGDQVFVITNRHVVEGAGGGGGRIASGIEITFSDGTHVEAKVTWRGPVGVDAAVLVCPRGSGTVETAPVRTGRSPTIGESVFAIGNPFGLGWSYSKGVISAIRRSTPDAGSLRLIQTQLPLNPGHSGGGLYDQAGALIGINTMTTDKHTSEGIGFAIAIADIIPFLEKEARLNLQEARQEEKATADERR